MKDLQFVLAMGLGIGSHGIPSNKNNGITPLRPVYKLRDKNLFRFNPQARHKKAVRADDAEVETSI